MVFKKIFLFILPFIIGSSFANGQGYQIDIQLDNYDKDSVFLAYYFGNSQYLKDTAIRQGDMFQFKGDEPLKAGVYMIVLPPDNQFFQVLVNENEQFVSAKADFSDINQTIQIEGSKDNIRFYEYLQFIREKSSAANTIKEKLENAGEDEKESLENALEAMNQEVKKEQKTIIESFPGSITAMLIKSNIEIELPEFSGTPEEVQMAKFQYYKKHYFDNIDLSDPRVINTPFVHERVNYYINKLTYQVPDSINRSLDDILGKFEPQSDGFQFYLVHFLNEYAKSKIVGMDAVYVHLVDKYYARGKAPWVEEDQLNKIIKNANTLRPILIGSTAPNLELFKQDGSTMKIHDLNSNFTVIFFWDPDCGHCKTSIPHMIEFYNAYQSKGVEVLGVCTKTGDKESECWEYIKEQGLDIWLNTSDKYLKSRYKQIYDIKTTPQIFVLDKDKKIVFKRIGAEQLPKVLDHLIDQGEG
jgi:peroxiredoxin